MEKKYTFHTAVMVLSFLLGGFSIILYLMQLSFLLQFNFVSGIMPAEGGFPAIPMLSGGLPPEERNFSGNYTNSANHSFGYGRRSFVRETPTELLLSPFSLVLLFTGLISTAAGFSILTLVRKKEIDFAKKSTRDLFLQPEEKSLVDELEKAGGALTQTELTKRTGLSRVKIHRVVRNLESKGLIIKQPFGMTNKIVFREK
jgi:uncharacterized membrane protein